MQIGNESLALARLAIDRCRKLATFSEEAGATTRTFLSAPMRECHSEIASWLAPLGAEISTDAAGNLRASYAGTDASADAPRLLIGSHLDSVPNAGVFDGILGVVIGVALIGSLQGKRLPFGIEIVGFSEEEGVRFGLPFIGSRALVGTLDQEMLERRDAGGVSIRAAIDNFGLDSAGVAAARLNPSGCLGYLEFHIEQGPVLEELGFPLAAVEAIAGQSRLRFTFAGAANHAGTTPMHLRRDALAGAAEWITAVEHEANANAGLVATVGAIDAQPGASNVIPGSVKLSLDVRHPDDVVRTRAVDVLIRRAKEIASRRGLDVNCRELHSHSSTQMDAFLVDQVEKALVKAGCAPYRMTSGAGHDAMILAQLIPTAMIFLRTPAGISHSPDESVMIEDVARAMDAGAHLLDLLAVAVAEKRFPLASMQGVSARKSGLRI